MADEAGVAEPGFVGDFASEPWRNRELAVRRIKLDFRDDQPLVASGEFIDFPHEIAKAKGLSHKAASSLLFVIRPVVWRFL